MSGFFKEPVSHWNISNSGGGGGERSVKLYYPNTLLN